MSRWNQSSKEDPVREYLVITDSRVKTQKDALKYLKAKGLDELISLENVILKTEGERFHMQTIYDEISQREDIKKSDIVFAGLKEDFEENKQFIFVELSEGAQNYNIGMYRWVFELLLRRNDPEFIEKAIGAKIITRPDESNPNWYIYLPPVAPLDYIKAFERYILYVEEVLQKA